MFSPYQLEKNKLGGMVRCMVWFPLQFAKNLIPDFPKAGQILQDIRSCKPQILAGPKDSFQDRKNIDSKRRISHNKCDQNTKLLLSSVRSNTNIIKNTFFRAQSYLFEGLPFEQVVLKINLPLPNSWWPYDNKL
jgi:hypothetical protein